MKKNTLLVFSGLSLIIFLLVLFNLQSNFLVSIDKLVSSLTLSLNSNFLISISKFISYIFEPSFIIILILVISLLIWFKGNKNDSAFFVAIALVSGIFIYIVKELVQRARPENMLIQETSFSFPSGHALISVVFFGFLAYLLARKIKSSEKKSLVIISSIIFILLISLSRLILNVHYFSDVLGGWFLGLFLLFLGIWLEKYL